MRFPRTAEAVFLLSIILISSFSFLAALAGDADVIRSGSLQTPWEESDDADITRYRNLQTPDSAPNDADVIRYRNLQGPLSEPNNADVIRRGNLQAPELADLLPDLEVSISSIEPSSPAEGQPTTITAIVRNIGEGEAHDIYVDFFQSARYTNPICNPDDDDLQVWPQAAEIDSLKSQESRSITVVWNATEILNIDNRPIEIVVDFYNSIPESNETNNIAVPIQDTDSVVRDSFGFDAQVDGYSFRNWGFTNEELADIRREVSIFFKSMISTSICPALVAFVYPFVARGGHCFGMAATSILYYKGIISKPVSNETFQMLKDEAAPSIVAYLMQQNSLSFMIPSWLKQTFTPFNLHDIYERIVSNLEDNNPLLMFLWKQGTKEGHAVTAINAYSVSDDIKNIVVYDNNFPGMGTIVTFDLQENEIIWNKLCSPPGYGYDRVDVAFPEPYTSDVIMKIIDDFISSLLSMNKRILTFQCPVDIDISDDLGRVTSSRNGGSCGIPDARVEVDNSTGAKIFFLPLDLNYQVSISAYDEGEVEMGQVLPDSGGGTFSGLIFNVTKSTSATCNLVANEPVFSLQIDEDGDGTVDQEVVPESSYVTAQWKTSLIGLDNYPVVDFATCNGTLWATSDTKLYRYEGGIWNTLYAPTYVTSIESYQNKLIIGGLGGLYSYDESTGFNLVFAVPTYIRILGVYNNTLYAGTFLDKSPKLYYCNGAVENPSNWHMDNGFSAVFNFSEPFGSIDSFAEYNGKLYLTSGGAVFCYDETGWSTVKTYVDVYGFSSMTVYNGKLHLATRDQGWRKPMYLGGSGFSGRVIEFDGENWTMILDHDYWIYSLQAYDNKLYVGTANKILIYNGTEWSTSFNALEGAYYAVSLTAFDGKIYVGMGNGYIFANPV